MKSNRLKTLALLSLFAVALSVVAAIIISGCSNTLEGDINANKPPVVYFVNIPPDSTRFSHNPEVYWFGTDIDGQITYYRYLVATVEEIGSEDISVARQWAADLDDTSWIYVDVNPRESDPQTAHIIPLTADEDNPITTFVDQLVFLQAFDDDDAASQIAIKWLSRNDHPPNTRIYNTIKDDSPYVNAVTAGGIVTGINLTWEGSDVRDYDEQGLVAPPFQFEWKLFGPYTPEEREYILDSLVIPTWFTEDGGQYYEGDTLTIIDSTWNDDTEEWEHDTTVIVFDLTTLTNTALGYWRDTLLLEDDTLIANRLVAVSDNGYDSWVYDTRDTIYNVYRNCPPADTTIRAHFLFRVKSRDDAYVPDPTPSFTTFPVIDPRHERDILILDFTNTGAPNYGQVNLIDSTLSMRKRVFFNMVRDWNADIDFDTSGTKSDYLLGYDYTVENPLLLSKLLKYKVFILYSDHTKTSTFMSASTIAHPQVLTAIDAGVNAWVTSRCLVFGSHACSSPNPTVPFEFTYYFGVEQVFFTSWAAFLRGACDFNSRQEIRMEDFVGAYSMDESQWPNLDIDTNRLHGMYYYWTDPSPLVADCPWIPDTAALPEVGWCERRYGTEVMYLYKSMYGPNHPLGFPYTIEGTPVGIRLETNLFRTVWFMFTPLAIDTLQMRPLAGSVMDWLYDPNLGSTTLSEKRYPSAATKITIDQARDIYDERKKIY